MGMKVSSIWLSDLWTVETKAYGESDIKTLVFNIHEVTQNEEIELPVSCVQANVNEHYTLGGKQRQYDYYDICVLFAYR